MDEVLKNYNKLPKVKNCKQHLQDVYKRQVLDTSVIIDGRIFDICETGFIEGPLVIPTFVLDELRHISDSSDSLKRTRGRRGLDILNKIQKELSIETKIWEVDFPKIEEVDSLSLIHIYIGTEPKTDEFKKYIDLNTNGYIITDELMRTNVPGVFAAGDVRDKVYRQITTAVAEGTIAALESEKYINK